MKFIVALLLTALLGYTAPLYFTWWSFAITSFIVAVAVPQSSFAAFLSGFMGMFLLWLIITIIIDSANESLLSQKIAMILPFGGSVLLLMLTTAFIGGAVGGFAALSGSFIRKAEKRKNFNQRKRNSRIKY